MEKKFNDIDELFISSLTGEEVIVPDSIKAGIDKGIAAKKRFGFWWLALIPILFVGAYFLMPESSSNDKETGELVSNDQNNALDLNGLRNSNSSHDTTSENTNKNEIIEDENLLTNSVDGQETINSSKKLTSTKSDISESNTNVDKGSSNPLATKKNTGTTKAISEGTGTKKDADKSSGLALSDKNGGNLGTDPNKEKNKSTDLDATSKTPIKTDLPANSTFKIDPEKSLTLMPLSDIELLEQGNTPVLPRPLIEKDNHSKKGFWMISATSGYQINKSSLSNDFISTNADVTNSYSEKNTSVLDLKGGYYFNRKIGLKTGVGSYQMQEDYTFSESEWQYTEDSTYMEDITFIYDSTGTIIDSTIISYYDYSTDSSYVNISNMSGTSSLRVIRIPLYFSYMFRYKRFLIEPEVFASVNFILNQQGVIAPGTTLIEYNNSNPVYRKMFWSGGVGLNLHYHLTEHFLLTGYGRFQKPFGNLYTGSYSKTITSYSFGGGVSFAF